jgi:hypothetical protein
VGPRRKAPGGFTHLLVAVDKFSKWIEARPVVNVRSKEAVSFFTDIIYRFDVPNTIEDHVWFEDRWMVAPWCDE